MNETTKLKLRFLSCEIQVSCKPGEQDALEASAKFVDEEMQSIKKKGGTRSTEKIAVITAMNLAHELIQLRQQAEEHQQASEQITDLNSKLAAVLEK